MRGRGLWLMAALFAAGCSKVGGEVHIEQEFERTLVFEPCDCADGDPLGFFGVELRDEDDRLLQFFEGRAGPQVVFFDRGGSAFELGPRDCDFFEGSLTRDYNRVTNDGRVRGDLTIDCRIGGGRRVEGSLSFERCNEYADDDWDDDDGWDDWDDDDGF